VYLHEVMTNQELLMIFPFLLKMLVKAVEFSAFENVKIMFFKLDANQARIINLAPLDIESILLFSSRRHNNKFSLTEIYILQLKFIIY